MAVQKDSTPAPDSATVINLADKFTKDLYLGAADEILEDVIHVLSLLEAYAYLDEDVPLIHPHAVSALASQLVEKIRRAQRHIAGKL
jgi:Na+-transporting methylmalonyl-CoA/oxaloacetate decarboxylase beta subunit